MPSAIGRQTGLAHEQTDHEVVIVPYPGERLELGNKMKSPDVPDDELADDPSEDEEHLDGEYERRIAA